MADFSRGRGLTVLLAEQAPQSAEQGLLSVRTNGPGALEPGASDNPVSARDPACMPQDSGTSSRIVAWIATGWIFVGGIFESGLPQRTSVGG
jgi:hypothetical protein